MQNKELQIFVSAIFAGLLYYLGNSCNTYCDIELPNTPLMKGANNLSMDTTIQPSKAYLKSKIESL